MATTNKEMRPETLAQARQKLEELTESIRTRSVLPKQFFDDLEKRIDQATDLSCLPPVVGFLLDATQEQLVALKTDLDMVLQNTATEKAKVAVARFLLAKAGNSRLWYGGLFDMWVRAKLLRQCQGIKFDVPLPNGRDSDIQLKIGGRSIRLENTVITEDDESRAVWERYCHARESNPNARLIRPGPLDPPNPRGPSQYYNARRMYAKVYDKLTKNLDPNRSQCADDEPNVLLVSFWGSGVSPSTPGFGWAIDELFTTQPSHAGFIRNEDSGVLDISLDAWIVFMADELVQKGQLTPDQYDERMDNISAIRTAPRRLGGIMLFDHFKTSARINYNADGKCSLKHTEMAELERLLRNAPIYDVCERWSSEMGQ